MAMAEIHRKIDDRVHPNQMEGDLVPILEPVDEKNHGAYVVSEPMEPMMNQHLKRTKIKRPLPAREPVSRRCLVAPRLQHRTPDCAAKQIVEFLGISFIK